MIELKYLKSKEEYSYSNPDIKLLDVFPNPGVDMVELEQREFTSLCPITGQPDYGIINISYQPDNLCVESKSLKLYLGAYRQEGGFAEQLTERIADALNVVLEPKRLVVRTKWAPRGGISIEVRKEINNGNKKGTL